MIGGLAPSATPASALGLRHLASLGGESVAGSLALSASTPACGRAFEASSVGERIRLLVNRQRVDQPYGDDVLDADEVRLCGVTIEDHALGELFVQALAVSPRLELRENRERTRPLWYWGSAPS